MRNLFLSLSFFVAVCLHALSQNQTSHIATVSRFTKTPICGVRIPISLGAYESAVLKKYKEPACIEGPENGSHVINGVATISRMPQDLTNLSAIAHEMMHLWLGTMGWETNGNRWRVTYHIDSRFAPEHLDQDKTQLLAWGLAQYLEHRMFTPILEKAGISDRNLAFRYEKEAEAGPAPEATEDLGRQLLSFRLMDPEAGKRYEAYLRREHWQIAIDAATAMKEIIDKEDPRTQAAADLTVQHCLDRMFSFGSQYNGLLQKT